MEGGGGGGFGFPFGGDPEDLMRSLREFAEQQAESVQEAQREQFATLTLNTAVGVVRRLDGEGKLATIDVLGEEITREAEARAIAQAYGDVFVEIERERLDSNISVKPTALGLDLSYDLCRENLESLLRE